MTDVCKRLLRDGEEQLRPSNEVLKKGRLV